MDDVQAIAGGALRTALVLPAQPGGYSVQVRVIERISGTAWSWEGPVEVSDGGAAVSPPLVAAKIEFDPSLDTAGLAAAVDEVEAEIRKRVPTATRIYLEPDLRRNQADTEPA